MSNLEWPQVPTKKRRGLLDRLFHIREPDPRRAARVDALLAQLQADGQAARRISLRIQVTATALSAAMDEPELSKTNE